MLKISDKLRFCILGKIYLQITMKVYISSMGHLCCLDMRKVIPTSTVSIINTHCKTDSLSLVQLQLGSVATLAIQEPWDLIFSIYMSMETAHI